TNRGKKSSAFLKTTTWGTLIAASVLMAAWGFSGHFVGSTDSLSHSASRAVAGPNPFHPASASRNTERSSAASEPRQGNFASAVELAGQPASASNSHSGVAQTTPFLSVNNPAATHPSESRGQAAAAGANSDAPVLIAAKMAPDLQGLDPEK